MLLFLGFTMSVQANVVTFYDDASDLTSTERLTITCNLCEGWIGPLDTDFSASLGDMFDINGGNPTDETNAVNAILGTSFGTGTKTETGLGDSVTVTSSAEYLLLKVGQTPDYAIIKLNGDSSFDFAAYDGTGSGLSHYLEFGQGMRTAVPVPAAVWLFGTALIGFVGVSRKRKVT